MSFTTAAALAAEFAAHAKDLNKKAGDVVIKVAADTQRDAKALAPVDTGFLRSSITRETTRRARDVSSVVGPEAEYGRFVNDGTYRMAPRPFLDQAVERNTPAFLAALEKLADL